MHGDKKSYMRSKELQALPRTSIRSHHNPNRNLNPNSNSNSNSNPNLNPNPNPNPNPNQRGLTAVKKVGEGTDPAPFLPSAP